MLLLLWVVSGCVEYTVWKFVHAPVPPSRFILLIYSCRRGEQSPALFWFIWMLARRLVVPCVSRITWNELLWKDLTRIGLGTEPWRALLAGVSSNYYGATSLSAMCVLADLLLRTALSVSWLNAPASHSTIYDAIYSCVSSTLILSLIWKRILLTKR